MGMFTLTVQLTVAPLAELAFLAAFETPIMCASKLVLFCFSPWAEPKFCLSDPTLYLPSFLFPSCQNLSSQHKEWSLVCSAQIPSPGTLALLLIEAHTNQCPGVWQSVSACTAMRQLSGEGCKRRNKGWTRGLRETETGREGEDRGRFKHPRETQAPHREGEKGAHCWLH